MWLYCEYLQLFSLFRCAMSIFSVFLYLFVEFAVCFCISLCCEYLRHFYILLQYEYLQLFSVFRCVVSILSVFLYLVAF